MPAPRWRRRVLLGGFAFVVALAMGPARQASAHAAFLGSDPVDGQTFDVAPAEASFQFSEQVLLSSSSVTLLELGKGTTWRLPLATTRGGRTVSATLPPLDKGAYVLRFVVVDPADLHRTVGSVGFGVGVEAPASAAGGQIDASTSAIVVREVADLALVLVVGAVVLVVLAAPGLPMLHAMTLIRRGVGVVVVGWSVGLIIEATGIGLAVSQWPRLLGSSDPGRRVLLGAVAAAAVWWVAHNARHVAQVERVARVVAGMVAVLVAVAAYGGHSAVGGNRALGLAVRIVHLGAVSAWMGVVVLGWWYGRRQHTQLWVSVSRVALVAAPVAIATGLWASGRTVSTVTALLSTQYGVLVVAKGVLAVAALAIGGWAFIRVRRGGAPHVAIEVGLMVVLTLAASVLAGSSPAVGPQFAGSPSVMPQVVTADLLDLTVSATLAPARPGANLLQVEILNTRRPEPGVIESATITLRRPTGTVAATYRVSRPSGVLEWPDATLDTPGVYMLDVVVERPARPVPVWSQRIVVQSVPVRQVAKRVSTATWWPIASMAAVVSLLGGVAAGAVVRRRRIG